MYQDTMMLRVTNGQAEISTDAEDWAEVNIDTTALPDGEYYVEYYIDIISYDPGREAPPAYNDIYMATPPEPEEVDYNIVGAVILDNDFNEIKKMTIVDTCKVIGVFEDEIYNSILKYARDEYGSVYN